MIRVLHIFHEMANGGIEHFVMDYYRHIDRTRVQFDFLVSVEEEGYFDREIQAMGGLIYHAYPLKKNPIRNYYDIARIVRENHYGIVHRHTGSAFGYFDLRAARHGGANHLIMHSHNNQAGNQILHKLSNAFLKIPCERFACSQEAGEWLFGPNQDFKVINNAIDCDKFRFRPEVRNRTRQELKLGDKFVIGHVGRFENQKNHLRMLKIFESVLRKYTNSVLVLVGIGSLQDQCRQFARDLGISDQVLFLGARADVPELMQAFDLFWLPSLYEGFPFVLVEAQASGLICVASTNVPVECNITGNVNFVDLVKTDSEWAYSVLKYRNVMPNRSEYAEKMKEQGYDINLNASELCSYYESLK